MEFQSVLSFPYRSPRVDLVNPTIRRLFQSGCVAKIQRKYLPIATTDAKLDQVLVLCSYKLSYPTLPLNLFFHKDGVSPQKALELSHFFIPFCLLGIGLVIVSPVLLLHETNYAAIVTFINSVASRLWSACSICSLCASNFATACKRISKNT